MSSLKAVQEEIEKALAANLRARINNALDNAELDLATCYPEDLQKLKRNDSEGELYLRLFIRSRQGDLEKAYKMMIDSLQWRKTYGIRDITEDWLEEEQVNAVLQEEGILFYHSTDKKKNPILIFQGNKYKYKKDHEKEQILERMFAYLLEKQHQQRLGKQIVVICDHQNATLDHLDLTFFKFVVNLFNIYYPHILDSFFVVDVSWRVSSLWRNIQKWLTPDTSPRFKFVEKAQLLDFIDKSKLLVSLGGQDKYKYKYPPEEETQNPFEPMVDESRNSYDTDSNSHFEDAKPIDANEIDADEISPPITSPGEQQTDVRTTQQLDMGGSLGTEVRNRFQSRNGGPPSTVGTSSSQDIAFIDDDGQNWLTVSPSEEITFQEVADASEVHETLTLTNNCENRIIFKIKTNSAANFRVKPRMGWIDSGSSEKVIVMLLLKGEASQEKHQWNKDKFLILFAEHTEEITIGTDIVERWKNTPKSCTRDYKLNCRVLDKHGMEKRPKTIDDAIEMNFKLQEQISQLQAKMENFKDPLKDIKEQLHQQKLSLLVMSIIIVTLLLILYWFR